MIVRAKVIYTSRISSIYNTHGRTGSDWGQTGVGLGVSLVGRIGVGLGLDWERRTGGRIGGGGQGVELGEADRGSNWGRRTGGRTGGGGQGVELGSDGGVGLGVGLGGRTGG